MLEVCSRLCDLNDDAVLFSHNLRAYRRYVDNFWSSAGTPATANGRRTAHYCCRLGATQDWVLEGMRSIIASD